MKISVYIPSYNQREVLGEAIESVFSQTLAPHQLIIVDDCSTDGSQEIIAGYASRYPDLIIPIYHTQNQGVAQTRTDALTAVSGDYVTYVDGDDRLLPTKLEKEARLLREAPDADIVFSNHYYITADGSRTDSMWIEGEIPPQGNVFLSAFARDFPRGSLFRNELVTFKCMERVGFYDGDLMTHEDWDMKIRLTKHFKAAYCPEPLLEHRHNPDGLSRSPAALRLESMKRVYEKNRALLYDLSESDRLLVERKLSVKFAQLAHQATEEELAKNKRDIAFKYWMESLSRDPKQFDLGLGPQIMLPRRLYSGLRSAYHRLHNRVGKCF